MEFIGEAISFILNIDVYLGKIISQYGIFSYGILFAIIFAETGFIFTPFLPGDSLLFAVGALSALGSFNIILIVSLLWLAAFLGDTVNYWIGYYFGEKLISNPKIPIKQEHINKTQIFYEKYGGKTIILARFIPIVRTFAPFVAGISKMNYKKFVFFNAVGGFVWVFSLTFLGYFFGNIPLIKNNFSLVVLIIILFSLLPIIFEYLKKLTKKS
jgi:membrane-associated protein